MCISTPDVPTATAAPQAPKAPASGQAGDEARRRQAQQRSASRSGTLLTGPRGLNDQASTQPKTLLGG